MKITPAFNLLLFTLFLGTILTTNGCVRVHVHVDVLENSNLPCSGCPSSPDSPEPNSTPTLGPPVETKIKIKKHPLVALTEDEALGILEAATKVANTDDQCNLKLVRDGDGEIEDFTWPQEGERAGVVSSEFDFNIVTGLPGVKVIEDVQWCNTPGPFTGCAELPGDSLVVEMLREKEGEKKPFYETLGVLWLHELGHNKGNYHRLDSSAVMNPQIFSEHKAIISSECGLYRQP